MPRIATACHGTSSTKCFYTSWPLCATLERWPQQKRKVMKNCMFQVPNPGQTEGLGIDTSHLTQEAPEVGPAAAPPEDDLARALASGTAARRVRASATGIPPRQAAVINLMRPCAACVLNCFAIPCSL